jgi:hypothetical protein
MKARILVLLLICLSLISFAEAAQTLRFKQLGYSIAPLEGTAKGASYQTLMMFLPPPDTEFAPNVNIQIQAYTESLENYVALSKGQFEELGFKVIKEKKDKTSALFEYSGETQGMVLHFYQKVFMKNGQAFLATASATEKQWPNVSAKLIACIDSFVLDK